MTTEQIWTVNNQLVDTSSRCRFRSFTTEHLFNNLQPQELKFDFFDFIQQKRFDDKEVRVDQVNCFQEGFQINVVAIASGDHDFPLRTTNYQNQTFLDVIRFDLVERKIVRLDPDGWCRFA